MLHKKITFRDIVSVEDWQAIQNSISEAISINIVTYSPEAKRLTQPSRCCHLCTDILPKTSRPSGDDFVCLMEPLVRNIGDAQKEINHKLPFGLECFIVPIRAVGHEVIAYVALGPIILTNRKHASLYADEAKGMGVDIDKLADMLIEINVFSYTKIYAIIKLIKDVFSHIAITGYHKKRLGEIAPAVIELDPLFSRFYEEKILKALLNTSILSLNADSGSIMTVDKTTHMLHIKASSRLAEEVVTNTEMKMGEGIAGMAAATAEAIVLPEDKNKQGISDKLKRKNIKSSLVVPFSKENSPEIYGVLNLNIFRQGTEFSKKDIALVKELVRMAGIALVPLSQVADINNPAF